MTEFLPIDASTPIEKSSVTANYYDTNLFYNVITGRSAPGILRILNNILIDWYSKK